MCPCSFLKTIGFYKVRFGRFPGVLEGVGSSGKLVGRIPIYPGIYKCPGSRVMAKNPGGNFVYRLRYAFDDPICSQQSGTKSVTCLINRFNRPFSGCRN